MNAKKRKQIRDNLARIATFSEGRMPAWTLIDHYAVHTMRDAVKAIKFLESKRKKTKRKIL